MTVTRRVTFDTDDAETWRHMVNRELARIRDDPRGLVPGTVKLLHIEPGRQWIVRYETVRPVPTGGQGDWL